MVVITGRIEAGPGGRRELCQALLQWAEDTRRAGGGDAHLSEDLECAHVLWLNASWPTREALEHHVRSPAFGRLVGAIELLAISDVLITGGDQFQFRDFRHLATSALRPPGVATRHDPSPDKGAPAHGAQDPSGNGPDQDG
jgi:quinol monooxygenase YgiN